LGEGSSQGRLRIEKQVLFLEGGRVQENIGKKRGEYYRVEKKATEKRSHLTWKLGPSQMH